jgi:hypothetical protein
MCNRGDHGGIVIKCHAGCTAESIVTAMALTMGDLMGKPYVVEEYVYTTEEGHEVYRVERWANPKTFRCRPDLPDPSQRVLYHLPAITWARINGVTVYLVEGEKDANTLIALGFVATTNVTGAGKWLPQYNDQLAGCHVVIIGDNDTPGRLHARTVAGQLRDYAASVALMRTPVGKDVSDFLAAGYTLERLVSLPDEDDIGAYRADLVRVRSVNWAWSGYFPLGKLSLVEGDPGDGKSLLTMDLAARWTTGALMPDGTNGAGPWPVIMVSAEDDPEDTLVQRLLAAGARLDYVHLITHGLTPEVPWTIAAGVESLKRLAVKTGAKGIVLDPLSAFFTDKTDTHNDSSVRSALQPLKVLAETTGAAVIAVRHLNKGAQGTKAIYRSSGSIGFVGAARAAYIVAPEPGDPAMRVFVCVKSNLARKPPALRYEILESEGGHPYVKWHGAVDMNAQTALDGPNRPESATAEETHSRGKERRLAGQWLIDLLQDGPKAWTEIVELGKEDGFKARTLERARADVDLAKVIGEHGNSSTRWALPTTEGSHHFAHLATSPEKGAVSLTTHIAGEVAKWEDGQSQSVTDPPSQEDLEAALMAKPEECEVCGSDDGVGRYAEPYWVVRCVAHSPFTYGGGE